MSSSRYLKAKRGYRVFAILFLVVLLVIFTFAAVISFPKDKPIDLNRIKPDSSLGSSAKWYKINEGRYRVLNEFGECTVSDSTFLYPITYYYFNVIVEQPDGEDFIISVRTGNKTELLREGQTPELYGMISDLDDSEAEYQLVNPGVASDRIFHVCLNDNDIDASGNLRNSIIFGLLALADIFLIIRIVLNMR